ncbi:TetR/AcrR family transcriptional regulator [Microbacterium luticocti]|uniref:TetR/AcrR family transcriptional regulator n=1 Tax=Microbacterium luticocti TaxID=451764 RepID=UPI0004046849|nr:TetR/AcrR family transcriptional regulator [Microbacterium luticocti]
MNLQESVRRRRGKQLEDAILDAGWEQLIVDGYGGFTIDAVAERAGTSRSVIYRRWPDRWALLEASVAHGLRRDRVEVPDTGSLRGDAIELLRRASASRGQLAPLMSVLVGAYFSESGRTFAHLREQAFGGRGGGMDVILDRAVQRGEADAARLTPRVRTVAADLMRHDMLMTFTPLPDEQITAIVDEILLPLVAPRPPAPEGADDIP